MNDLVSIEKSILDYVITIDELYGHYLDMTAGFIANARLIEETQAQMRANLPEGTNMDDLGMIYGRGSPNNADNRMLHQTTQGIYKERNEKGGHNHYRAAQLLIVLLFEYWESEHRAKVAESLGLADRKDLKIPIIGDMRLLRQDVIHHRSIVRLETVRKLTVINGLVAGTELTLNGENVEQVVLSIKAALDEEVIKAGGKDPEHRKIWRVQ